jgi:hypothetical protein
LNTLILEAIPQACPHVRECHQLGLSIFFVFYILSNNGGSRMGKKKLLLFAPVFTPGLVVIPGSTLTLHGVFLSARGHA